MSLYWSRIGSIVDFFAWLALTLAWGMGGWLLCTHLFRLRGRERLMTGLASGMLLFILISNLLAYVMPLEAAFWGAALILLLAGFLAAYRSHLRPVFQLGDLLAWPQWLALLGLTVLFTLINRGLAIFDDYFNLPMVSWLAAGNIPPSFYLNPNQLLDYHYGLHLLAASLVRIAGFFPWSAFDLVKAFSISLPVLLGMLWLRRFTSDRFTLVIAGLVILFAGGTRWLLLMIPPAELQRIGQGIELLGSAKASGATLAEALASAWHIEGEGPFPFAFAFSNGIFRPLSIALGSSGGLIHMTVLLLLLLTQTRWRPWQGLVFGLILASAALTGEHLFIMAWSGLLVTAGAGWLKTRSIQGLRGWGWALLPGVVLAPIIGGVISEMLRGILSQFSDQITVKGIAMPDFKLQWPPVILSSHLGTLQVTNPRHLLVGLAEIGPGLLLAAWMIWKVLRQIRSGKWGMAGLNFGALAGFLATMILRFSVRQRDLSRMMDAALFIWLALAIPYAWLVARRGRAVWYSLIQGGCILVVAGGLALLPGQLIAVGQPQLTFFVNETDAMVSQEYWDRLDKDAWVLDLGQPVRSPLLFARGTGPAYQDVYIQLPEFKALLADPHPAKLAYAGYSYAFLDETAWQIMGLESQRAFLLPCVSTVKLWRVAAGEFRWLVDIRNCD